MEYWRNDLTYALRSLIAARKFSTTVILTLALGLGANTAVFGVLHAVVLTPLPYPAADRGALCDSFHPFSLLPIARRLTRFCFYS